MIEILIHMILANILFIPLYIKCENWEKFKVLAMFCQTLGIATGSWIWYKQIPEDYVVSCMGQGNAHILFYA